MSVENTNEKTPTPTGRIFIIEDDDDYVELLNEDLQDEQITAYKIAKNPDEARSMIEQLRAGDVVILDGNFSPRSENFHDANRWLGEFCDYKEKHPEKKLETVTIIGNSKYAEIPGLVHNARGELNKIVEIIQRIGIQ